MGLMWRAGGRFACELGMVDLEVFCCFWGFCLDLEGVLPFGRFGDGNCRKGGSPDAGCSVRFMDHRFTCSQKPDCKSCQLTPAPKSVRAQAS